MTVAELIAHLQTLPQDREVHFRGYSCGSVWHAPVKTRDFIEETHLETDESIVEITAEWN
jgi:hypothetical protein